MPDLGDTERTHVIPIHSPHRHAYPQQWHPRQAHSYLHPSEVLSKEQMPLESAPKQITLQITKDFLSFLCHSNAYYGRHELDTQCQDGITQYGAVFDLNETLKCSGIALTSWNEVGQKP
jgi:hypothetical protein